MNTVYFSGERDNTILYSDRISLKYLKIKLETFLFAVKLYDLKITYTQSILQVEPQEYSSHVISGSNYTPRT